VKQCVFALDCDRAMRKIMQVVYERLRVTLLTERVCVCRCLTPTPTTHSSGEFTFAAGRRMQSLRSAASLSENTEKDYGRVVNETKVRFLQLNQVYKTSFRTLMESKKRKTTMAGILE
jgi:hypothetical protein